MKELYQIPLFEDIPEAELHWLIANSHEETLENGRFFFHENAPADYFYIVLEGELQVTRTMNGKEVVLGTTPRGIIGGELSLLYGMPSQVSARAILPSHLMVFDQRAFREIFSACPVVGGRIFQIAAERTFSLVASLQQQEKMAALGKLSAGLAHELNNPAAAARRAAQTLRETLPTLQAQTLKLNGSGLTKEQVDQLVLLQQKAIRQAAAVQPLLPLAQSEREDEVGEWLEQRGLAGWEMAATFVSAGVQLEQLEMLAGWLADEQLADVLGWFHETLAAVGLLDEIEQSSRRISDLVGAVKSYTYMDQAQEQDVDIHQGLESTLTVMKHKLANVTVVREYDPNLPAIVARGSELNQVWTNLIDNAVDAMQGEGTLRVITRCEHDFVMVEIADNGVGIPQETIPRLFEPFFTTKGLGVGTGLGLDISYRIVKAQHGTIEVQSVPGHTRFIVRLPSGVKSNE